MAGIAAMVLTGILGNSMGLNNTAAFMSSCVAFVAVSMWMDSRITTRRRRDSARDGARETARERAQETEADRAAAAGDAGSAPDRQFEAEQPKREGRGS